MTIGHGRPSGSGWRPLHPRDPHEHHRAATPLELLFDLVSVIAVASAAVGLHHAIAEGHALQGTATFFMAFFAIWWAWMNFTWFSSAYDNDDVFYRLTTMVIMGGSLVIAAGIPALFAEQPNFNMVIIGYVVMRLGMIVLWLRAAASDPTHRRTTMAYAVGIFITQAYWVVFTLAQPLEGTTGYALWIVGVLLEISVPAIAEQIGGNTPWHRHHIMERYSLLNLIVLGETLLSGSNALRESADHFDGALVTTAVSALVIVFALWWAYFSRDEHLQRAGLRHALFWGYGHFFIFAAGAATGAGFEVAVDAASHHGEVSAVTAAYAVAVPVAVYFVGLWTVRDRFIHSGVSRHALVIAALLILLAPAAGAGIPAIAALAALGVIVRTVMAPAAPAADH